MVISSEMLHCSIVRSLFIMVSRYLAIWLIVTIIRKVTASRSFWPPKNPYNFPEPELEHFPELFTTELTRVIEGSTEVVPSQSVTPDFRVEELPYLAYSWGHGGMESDRPYRISPLGQIAEIWGKPGRQLHNLICVCTTVYRKRILLAGCVLLTRKHLLTTATTTLLALSMQKPGTGLEDTMGAWYEVWYPTNQNTSRYFTPVRIAIHPKYIFPHNVNASHPLPFTYDLAVWESMKRVEFHAYTCNRAASGYWYYSSPIPYDGDPTMVVGYQFMKAFRKKPMPWYRYAVRCRHYGPQPWCPKTEWGWFNCIQGDWARLGMESGASQHFRYEDRRQDGLGGILAFSLRLRSKQIVHYFTILDTYPVLEFLYDAYLGRMEYIFMDHRFYNYRWYSAVVKPWFAAEIDAIEERNTRLESTRGYPLGPLQY